MDEEQWKSVVGYEGLYEVSSHGRVRSLDRAGTQRCGPKRIKGRMLTSNASRGGRPSVSLRKDGMAKYPRIHRIVAAAFIGPPPNDGAVVCHSDGDPTNNRADNLAWHPGRVRSNRGAKNGRNKLTEAVVREIRAMIAAGKTQRTIAAKCGIHHTTVNNIKTGRTWAWLE